MNFGIPREQRPREYRVGLTPAAVDALVKAGHAVFVEREAGSGAGFDDEAYRRVGGQLDFIRGAARSKGGKPIIALPASTKGGSISRIVSTLKLGAGVTTTRNDVHYVVTEFGVAELYGKTVRQRVQALIAIADPAFREELTQYAREAHYL